MMDWLDRQNPYIPGLIGGALAGVVLGLLLQSAVMGVMLGVCAMIIIKNVFRERKRKLG